MVYNAGKPSFVISGDRKHSEMTEAGNILKSSGCVIQLSLDEYRQDRFVVRRGSTVLSPAFFSLYNLCLWVVKNSEELSRRIENVG